MKKIIAILFIGQIIFAFASLSIGEVKAATLGGLPGTTCSNDSDCLGGDTTPPNAYCSKQTLVSTNGICVRILGKENSVCLANEDCEYPLYCDLVNKKCLKPAYREQDPQTNTSIKFTPQVSIPGLAEKGKEVNVGHLEDNAVTGNKMMVSDLMGRYINAFYKYGLTIIGILAAVILMAGGIIWLTSAGSPDRVNLAKDMISGSLIGIALLYGAYLILNTINPELTKLNAIKTNTILPIKFTCCEIKDSAQMMSDQDCKAGKGKIVYGAMAQNGRCVTTGCCYHVTETAKGPGPGYGGTTYETVKSCVDTTAYSCGNTYNEGPKHQNIFYPNKCSEVEACKEKIDNKSIIASCENKKNTELCNKNDGGAGRCYNGLCYVGPGLVGEPCGNDGGICTKLATPNSSCSDTPGYYHDAIGGIQYGEGRLCEGDGETLDCCYYDGK